MAPAEEGPGAGEGEAPRAAGLEWDWGPRGDGPSPYAALGLPDDPAADAGDDRAGFGGEGPDAEAVKKAYKRRARECHPDKNRHRQEAAAAEFARVQRAYTVLTDAAARREVDLKLQASRLRRRRERERDGHRRQLARDLEARERAAEAGGGAGPPASAAARAAAALQAELRALREAHRRRREEARTAKARARAAAAPAAGLRPGATAAQVERSLKVSWDAGKGAGYGLPELRVVFGRFGVVEDVVLRDRKGRGTAIVVMASREGALGALDALCGDPRNPLLVVPLDRGGRGTVAGGPGDAGRRGKRKGAPAAAAELRAATATLNQDYEAAVLAKLEAAGGP